MIATELANGVTFMVPYYFYYHFYPLVSRNDPHIFSIIQFCHHRTYESQGLLSFHLCPNP